MHDVNVVGGCACTCGCARLYHVDMSKQLSPAHTKLISAGVILTLAILILAWQLWPASSKEATLAEEQQQAIMEQVGRQPPPIETAPPPTEPDKYGRKARPVK